MDVRRHKMTAGYILFDHVVGPLMVKVEGGVALVVFPSIPVGINSGINRVSVD